MMKNHYLTDKFDEEEAEARLAEFSAYLKRENVKDAMKEISIIKYYVANAMQRVVDRALQCLGGLGMTDDTPIAYYWAGERAGRIYDGADEVHRLSVARRVLRDYKKGKKVRFGV